MTATRAIRPVRNEIARLWAAAQWAGVPLIIATAVVASTAKGADAAGPEAPLAARVVAVGLSGAGAVSAVGVFHPGGPIHDKPEFAALTRAGRVLDPSCVLVASASSFGLPLARPADPGGSVLSLAPETAIPLLASNTTLAGGSDLYLVSRGNGTLLRLRQDGTVLAVRQVAVGGTVLGAGRLNGIAVSPDAQRLWVTVSGALPGHEDAPGALLELPAFGPGRAASRQAPDYGCRQPIPLPARRPCGEPVGRRPRA